MQGHGVRRFPFHDFGIVDDRFLYPLECSFVISPFWVILRSPPHKAHQGAVPLPPTDRVSVLCPRGNTGRWCRKIYACSTVLCCRWFAAFAIHVFSFAPWLSATFHNLSPRFRSVGGNSPFFRLHVYGTENRKCWTLHPVREVRLHADNV